MDLSIKNEANCVDMPYKDLYVMVHYSIADPGKEFEIVKASQLEPNWDTLRRGVEVMVKFGNAKVQAYIVGISAEIEYFLSHFEDFSQEYLMEKDQYENNCDLCDLYKYKSHRSHRSHRSRTTSPKNTEKNTEEKPLVIKVRDAEVQTDLDHEYEELGKEHEALQAKHEKLLNMYKNLKFGMQGVLQNCDGEQAGCSSNSSNSSNTVLQPVNRELSPMMLDYDEDSKNIHIGKNRTAIPKTVYDSVNWRSFSASTRKLLVTVFSRKTLATHSLTGKPSPAFLTAVKEKKMKLDPLKIADIVEEVSRMCNVSASVVRSAITTKCADENKMYRKRLAKCKNENDENQPIVPKV